MYIYAYICIYTCICIYIYIHIHSANQKFGATGVSHSGASHSNPSVTEFLKSQLDSHLM